MKHWVLLTAAMYAGCVSREPPRSERIVVDIAGQSITVAEFDRFVESSVQQDQPVLASDVMEALFEQFIEEQLLLRAADDAGVQADPTTVARRREAIENAQSPEPAPSSPAPSSGDALAGVLERQIRIEKLVEAELFEKLEVTDDEVERHFEANRAFFERPESVTLSQVLVEDEALAGELLAELKRKPSLFEEIAKEHSVAPEATRGGKLGTFGRGELPPSLEEPVFALRKGRLSEVVATDFGFHIFLLHDKADAEPLELDAVRDTIRVDLLQEKSARELARYLEELKETYPVTVHREHLSFAFLEWEDGKSTEPVLEESP